MRLLELGEKLIRPAAQRAQTFVAPLLAQRLQPLLWPLDQLQVHLQVGHTGPGHLELEIPQHALAHGEQAAGAGALGRRHLGDAVERRVVERRLDAVGTERPLVLPQDAAFGLGKDAAQVGRAEFLARHAHRQAADKFGLHAVFHEVGRGEIVIPGARRLGFGRGGESDLRVAAPLLDDAGEPREGAADDEEDAAGVDGLAPRTPAALQVHHGLHLPREIHRVAQRHLGLLHQL